MFTRVRFVFLGVALLCSLSVFAQTLSGVVTDQKSREGLISATVQLIAGDGKINYTSTDLKGMFQFKKLPAGTYTLQISYVGYKTYKEAVIIPSSGEKKVNVTMREDVNLLDEISVNARATRAEQKGDSLLYNAEAFKVMQGSSAEDLLAKMPGIVVEGGSIQAQGEEVKKVLVDGKEFFDGDVNLAIKNLPSDIIAGIEVFDKKSEQAEFTGFDDGEEVKTINIVTKGGFRQGTFGEVSAGYGTEDRYKVNGNVNFFNEDRRISLLGMSNNVNQQNFSQEDLAGVMSSGASGKRRGGGRNGGRGGAFGGNASEITFDNISSTVSKEMSQNAMKAVIIAVVCMLLYIWIRFRDIRFASSAILALMHDIAIVFGFYVVSRISVGSTFIACMLTILGYSINSTIVIFDRIRENLPELKREPIESLVDRCITDTLTRSIYSSLTTFITIFVLFVMGVSSIRDFAAPLMVGIVCGAYTSVCITGALWYVMKHVGKNKYVPSKAVQNKTKNK